jgi:4-hydroxy-L-threonine phosphate dehydrogenase PdxA
MKKIKKILIVAGDPNSINSEIIFKSWLKLNNSIKKKIYVIANYELIQEQFSELNYSLRLKNVDNLNITGESNELKIINVGLKFNKVFSVEKKNASPYVLNCLDLAHKLALNDDVLGLINCAIDKSLFSKKNIGVTEYLATKCGLNNKSEVMMIKNDQLAVCPITTHLDLKNVSQNIKSKTIITKIKTIQKSLKKMVKKKPKIGVLGLNPHNGELKKNTEEITEIIPAIKYLKNLGFNINGPLAADSVFINDYKNYDIIVGMYHDQVLTPFKTLFKFDAINITLGLKYFRASPDHGVAKNIIKKDKADPESLIKAIKYINNL